MTRLNRTEIENAIWRVTMKILGYDPDSASQDVQSRVRISWPLSDSGNPNWSRHETTVFIRLATLADEYSQLWDITYSDDGQFTENVANHRAFEVSWIVYGVEALETAQKLRYGLLRESIRQELNGSNMAFKSVVRMPVHMPEQDRAGDWWERYDLTAQMYLRDTRQYSEHYIDTAPNISTSYAIPGFVLDVSRLDVDALGYTVTVTAEHE